MYAELFIIASLKVLEIKF